MVHPPDNRQMILALLSEHEESLKKLGVRKLGLFGSFIRNEQTPKSDIDILVDFMPEQETFRNLMGLHGFLTSLFDRNVELVTVNSLSPYIGPHILGEVEYVPFIH